jgi:hypothetical protein
VFCVSTTDMSSKELPRRHDVVSLRQTDLKRGDSSDRWT